MTCAVLVQQKTHQNKINMKERKTDGQKRNTTIHFMTNKMSPLVEKSASSAAELQAPESA